MKKIFQYLSLVLVISFSENSSLIAQSQDFSCGQHIILSKLLKDSTFKRLYDQEQRISSNTQYSSGAQNKGVLYKIPVVFHIVHNNGVEKIDRSQVLDALAILNRDLRALRADTATVDSLFKPLIADIEVEFVLATKAPDGTCFSGVTMTQTPYSYIITAST